MQDQTAAAKTCSHQYKDVRISGSQTFLLRILSAFAYPLSEPLGVLPGVHHLPIIESRRLQLSVVIGLWAMGKLRVSRITSRPHVHSLKGERIAKGSVSGAVIQPEP